jgi:CxxC motif-containing protein (DUF1111 family)
VPDPEIPASIVLETLMYVRLLAAPARGGITAAVQNGAGNFNTLGCASCHTPAMETGPNSIPQLSEVTVNLYSDLLLHDMGDGLADNRPDRDASGSEWRTAPLWGTRIVPDFLGGAEHYLHDGRATTLDDAIGWHGGEAEAAKNAYEALGENERQDLVAFLKSL